MASNYPGSLDSFDTIASDKKTSDSVGGRTHRAMHNDLGDAIEAIEAELGTTPSGSESTVAARLAAIESGARLAADSITATQLAADAVGSSEIADAAVTAAKLAVQPGNLLTANQASVETDTTGLSSTGMTISRETIYSLHGTASLRCESTTTGAIAAGIPAGTSNAAPVTAGATYTYTAAVRPINTQTLRLYIVYRGADGSTYVSEASGSEVSCPDSTWTTLQCTLTAPAGAYYAHFWVYAPSATVGQRFNLDCLGVWRGSGGTWQLPGVPVPGQGLIYANGAVELPGGDYAPEGVVTASPGSTFLQTSGAATVTGMLSWRKASGTGNTGWVPEGALADTGWRDVSSLLAAGWSAKAAGLVAIRRLGPVVHFRLWLANSGTAGQDILTYPDGFRPQLIYGPQGAVRIGASGGMGTVSNISSSYAASLEQAPGTSEVAGQFSFVTDNAWPSSLPGSAA